MKTTNYSEKEVEVLRTRYTGKNNKSEVTALSSELNKSENSVRSKLAQLGLYKKENKTRKTSGETKTDIATDIGKTVGLNEVEQEALAKTTVAVLEKLRKRLTV